MRIEVKTPNDYKVVDCKFYSMSKLSIFRSFKFSTPKIDFDCGNCGMRDYGTIDLLNVSRGKPYIKCNHCGTLNRIPILEDGMFHK